jgi:hypothetical protein
MSALRVILTVLALLACVEARPEPKKTEAAPSKKAFYIFGYGSLLHEGSRIRVSAVSRSHHAPVVSHLTLAWYHGERLPSNGLAPLLASVCLQRLPEHCGSQCHCGWLCTSSASDPAEDRCSPVSPAIFPGQIIPLAAHKHCCTRCISHFVSHSTNTQVPFSLLLSADQL